MGLVSAFGSVRNAVNARPEEIGTIAGWGEKKVERWCQSVREPFRIRKTARRGIARTESSIGLTRDESSVGLRRDNSLFEDGEESTRQEVSSVRTPSKELPAVGASSSRLDAVRTPSKRAATEVPLWEPGEDEVEALLLAAAEGEGSSSDKPQFAGDANTNSQVPDKDPTQPSGVSEGMMAALAKLREQ